MLDDELYDELYTEARTMVEYEDGFIDPDDFPVNGIGFYSRR